MSFIGRRSPVLCRHGCVACSQPLATDAGISVLKKGGNAADAAVAVAAALNVTQPCSTGLGGDCFCLFYDASSSSVRGLNGSGRAPQRMSLDLLASQGYGAMSPLPVRHAHNVTVPGAAAGWVDTIESMGSGKLSLHEILEPAIRLAEEGYPVAPVTSELWECRSCDLLAPPTNTHGRDLLLGGKAPRPGDIIRLPHLAKTFRALAERGKAGFYRGRVAQAIVDCVQEHGGELSLADLADHTTTYDQPIKTCYRGINVWEMPPSGQGLTALIALSILEDFDISNMTHNSGEYLHTLIEALQLAFADTQWHCTDPTHYTVPTSDLLSKTYAAQRRALMNPKSCLPVCERGEPRGAAGGNTVYFCVSDSSGNVCSFINSNYMGFGTGLVPEGCGFSLHNRGANFSLSPDHPNCLAPGKRPYHTIIPGMATWAESGDVYAGFGVMGAFMQPQGHVQVLLNMIDHGMDPQTALDAARFCIGVGDGDPATKQTVYFEEGISHGTVEELRALGHSVTWPVSGFDRKVFGRGQVVCSRPVGGGGGGGGGCESRGGEGGERATNVWWAGSDKRSDGVAIGY